MDDIHILAVYSSWMYLVYVYDLVAYLFFPFLLLCINLKQVSDNGLLDLRTL